MSNGVSKILFGVLTTNRSQEYLLRIPHYGGIRFILHGVSDRSLFVCVCVCLFVCLFVSFFSKFLFGITRPLLERDLPSFKCSNRNFWKNVCFYL